MKSFKDVVEEQKVPEWLRNLLEELDRKQYAVESSYWTITVYIFGNELPKSVGYDKLGENLNEYKLSSSPFITNIQGNSVAGTIEYHTDKLTELGTYFNKHVAKNASYSQTMGNDGNHPTGWV